MANKVEVRLQKKGPDGNPRAELVVPKNTRFEDLVKLQKTIFRDHLPDVGLKPCEGCLSGLNIDIRDKVIFDKVIAIEF
jgi:hypothetical protein